MRSPFVRAALTAAAALLVAVLPVESAQGQKALVYCPVGIDDAGCSVIVSALSKRYLAVDRGYDGSGGTIDLATADLNAYRVFVIPSLADDPAAGPYGKLRDPAIAMRLHGALLGRVALWSGTPDQGSANRTEKDVLIRNLATWAAGNWDKTLRPGLVAFADQSIETGSRYDWLTGLVRLRVAADTTPNVASDVKTIDEAGNVILSFAGTRLAYENMASYGFQLPPDDAVNTKSELTATRVSGQVVMLTATSVTGTAEIHTDKPDYAPFQTVTITGSGFKPGEVVTMTFEENPSFDVHPPITTTADANGNFTNTDFVTDANDANVAFIVTAVGNQGSAAQTTFTDATKVKTVSVGTQSPASVIPGNNATYTVTVEFNGSGSCTVNLTISGLPAGATGSFSPTSVTGKSSENKTSTLTISTALTTVSGSFTVTATGTGGAGNDCNSTDTNSGNGTLTVNAVTATTLALAAPSPASVTFGSTGPVTLTATLTRTTGGAAVSGATIDFKVDGSSVGTALTNASGVASISTYNPSALAIGSHNVQAFFTGATISGTVYSASTSATQTLTVTQATPTVSVTGGTFPYDGAAHGATGFAYGNGGVGDVLTPGVTFSYVGTGSTTYGPTATAPTNAGTYQVTASFAGNASYTIASNTASVTITPKTVTASVTANDKTYDGTNPATIASCTVNGLVGTDVVTCTATAATFASANASAVAQTVTATGITLGGAAASNYLLSPTSATASAKINPKPATWTTNASSKTYGDADPGPLTTGSGSGFLVADGVTAAYSRAAGENASPPTYPITATLSASPGLLSNYTITNTGAEFTINKRPATWTTNPNTKIYGQADPSPLTTGSGSNFVAGDGITASYSRATGETVAASPYAISATLAPPGVLVNYIITNAGAAFTITTKTVTASVTASDKTYDGSNAASIASCAVNGKVGGDVVTCSVEDATFASANASAAAQAVTATGITLGGADASNYVLDPTTAATTAKINPKPATWTTNASSKTYGDADPSPLTTGSGSGFLASDGVSAAYSRAAGESASPPTYHITATLSATGLLSNYTITNAGAEFTINKRLATWTTNPNSKTYGNPDPSPLTTGNGSNFVAVDNVTAVYTRAPGETVAGSPYAITATLSPAGVLGNYIITNAGAAFTITTKTVTASVTASDKTYDGNNAASIASCTVNGKVGGDVVTCSVEDATFATANANTAPQTVTATGITLGGADASNYVLDPTTAATTAKINPKAATWTTTANSKTYGEADPSPLTTGSGSGFLAADGVSAAYSRVAGETVTPPTYHITATMSATGLLSNYTITNAGAEFTINKRLATWTTNPNTKVYGDLDPSPLTTGTGTNFVVGDGVSATYARTPGETVTGAPYLITATLSPAGVLGNYIITNDGANFTITPKPVTPSVTGDDKTYDGNNTATIASCTVAVKVGSDDVTCSAGSATFASSNANASPQVVTANGITLTGTTAPNYMLSSTTATTSAKIDPKLATWTTNGSSKTYGDADPSPLTTGSGSGFLVADGVTAAYSRVAGETVTPPTYHITATLSATGLLSNYTITNAGADFSINKRSATWTTNNNSKVYGTVDPIPLTTGSGTNFVAGDGVTATYTRAPGEPVLGSPYHITATLSPVGVLGNYTITNLGADFTITPKTVTASVTASDKTYDGNNAASIASCTVNGKVGSDVVTCSVEDATFASANASALAQAVSATGITLGGADASNYVLDPTTAATTAKINPKAATWTTTANSKTYGDADPSPLTTGSGSGFLAADGVTATYSRVAGANASPPAPTYHITATLSATGLLSNYTITNAGAEFTINKRLATWTTNPNSKVYGDLDPSPLTTGNGSNFVASDGISASYSRATGETVAGSPYAIAATLSPAGVLGNYIITNNGADFTITPKPLTVSVASVTTPFGNATPLTFTANYSAFAFSETPAVLGGTIVFTQPASTYNNTTFAGVYPITVSGHTSTNYNISYVPGTLTIADGSAPVVSNTTVNGNPTAINATMALSANISDATTGHSEIVSACYAIDTGNGPGPCVPMALGAGTFTRMATATIPAVSTADVFQVCVYGTDGATPGNTNAKMDCVLVAVYDPDAGFVTGGGWITSPLGAYVANPSLTGKATFGFVAKYKKGQQAPDGNTEFQFQAANLNFKATAYDWLVVAGNKAQYKGVGTINGTAGYGFMLTANDGDSNGGKKPDTFRMKIWLISTGAIVYDNQMNAPDTGDPTTVLGGGSIVIHSN